MFKESKELSKTQPLPSLPASSSNQAPVAVIPPQRKQHLGMCPTETPVTESPMTKLKLQPLSVWSAMEAQLRCGQPGGCAVGEPMVSLAVTPPNLKPEICSESIAALSVAAVLEEADGKTQGHPSRVRGLSSQNDDGLAAVTALSMFQSSGSDIA